MNNDINKLQEEIYKSDIKKVEKMWKSMEKDSSLEYHLDRMTKEELVKIATKYNIRGLTSLKKADVVLKVKEGILYNIDIILNLLDEDALEYIEELISLGGIKKYTCNELINANYFRNRGLMFTGIYGNNLHVILPKEVQDIINHKINQGLREKTKKNTEIIKLLGGMIYYYGVLTFDNFLVLLDKYVDYSIEDINIKQLILDGEEVGFDYQVDNDIVFHIDVEDEKEILEEQNNNEDIKYYNFTKMELLKASRPDFFEDNKQIDKLQRVMGELFVIDKNILKEEVASFSIAIKNLIPLDEAMGTFLQGYEIESDFERDVFKVELTKLGNSIRSWEFKGHTKGEIEGKRKIVINEVKIGRNDFCPCGSNKKYKKCCGK